MCPGQHSQKPSSTYSPPPRLPFGASYSPLFLSKPMRVTGPHVYSESRLHAGAEPSTSFPLLPIAISVSSVKQKLASSPCQNSAEHCQMLYVVFICCCGLCRVIVTDTASLLRDSMWAAQNMGVKSTRKTCMCTASFYTIDAIKRCVGGLY